VLLSLNLKITNNNFKANFGLESVKWGGGEAILTFFISKNETAMIYKG